MLFYLTDPSWIAAGLLYLALCGLCGYIATQKRRNFIAWAGVSLIFTPIIGLIALAAIPAQTS